jgi:hypothetical protein
METHTDYFVDWLIKSIGAAAIINIVSATLASWSTGALIGFFYLVGVVVTSVVSAFLLFRSVGAMITDEAFHGEPGSNA